MYPQTMTNAWEDIVFDFSDMTGKFAILHLCPDFADPVNLTDDITIYFDNIRISSSPAPMNMVTFNVDMTNADPFDPTHDDVYISGDFAGWTKPGENPMYMMTPTTENPMIYSLTVPVEASSIAYKYFRVIDNTASWDNGEWTGDPNRVGVVNGTTTFNNIWGATPVVLTFNVDMTNDTTYNATDDI